MKISNAYISAALLTTASLLSACTNTTATSNNQMVNTPMKQTAVKAQDAFFKDFDAEAMKEYFREDYVQHNPHVPTGLAPALGFLPVLKEAGLTYKTHRLLEDGDFIIMHNTYDNAEAFGAREVVTFDVWRMQDGQVAEHWDAVAPVVKDTASGRSQFDGPTLVTDTDKTQANKQLVANFMEDVFFGKAPENITEYISTEQYDQHNTMVKDGLDGLNEALTYLASQNNMFEYHKVHRILGEGNFVLTQSAGRWNGKPQAFYDLFRIEDDKIVEHWDIIQEIPEKMAHDNGMF
ncbi:nuclear transport factor 2 family protein [Vibrio sp. CAU 1672]|uniref:nuclear transport factor 2 family protein n=1 Tax=Vibrio sp. CAU 1672 TaxID=3032594 RepID=UPI0023DC0C52|nr:nuclear transport factor 2 family protein [Vibrio sp. CAU 1672]MDF2155127.1 nuclear transport factor 2 family protein [Vibrio sp. CAU 1672]